MTLSDLEIIVARAFCSLDSSILLEMDEHAIYSDNYLDEIIEELQKVFDKIKSKDINSLIVKDSHCKYCYPEGKAYSFHHPITGKFIIRYVIAHEGESDDGETIYRIEECRNNPIPYGQDGMPF